MRSSKQILPGPICSRTLTDLRPDLVIALALLVAMLALAPFATAQATPTDQQVNARVDALMKQMTLQEKIGQLTQLGAKPFFPDPVSVEEHIRRGEAGSVLWTVDTQEINRLQHLAVDQSRLHIPLLFGYDVIHGYRNVFPVPIGMAASWDPAMVEHAQSIAAKEASVSGIQWSFGPMVDIARDPRWGRILEGAGEDPYLGAAMARAQVRGFQGPALGTPGRVVGSVKHFAGYGAADGGRDYDSVYIPDMQFRNVYLPPFQAAIDAGVGTVMSAYMDLNDVPASGNRWLLRDVLRHDMGFRGFVVSDAVAVKSLIEHGYAKDGEDAARRGILAGVDMDMASGTYLNNLTKLIQSGKVSMPVIDESVRNILAIKVRIGLFEHPYADPARMQQVYDDPEHRNATRIAAQRSMVLLRNENNLLPLKRDVKSIAVVGPLADDPINTLGSWIVEGSIPAVTVFQGIKAKTPGARVEYAAGGDMRRDYRHYIEMLERRPEQPPLDPAVLQKQVDEAVETVRRADVAVVVVGEKPNMAGEAASRAKLHLPGNQQQLVEAVVATGKPVVLVLINGRPLDLTWASEHVPAILVAWHPGTEGGNAVADVLFGDANPGGKLPFSWPRSVGQVPVFYAHNLTQLPEGSENFNSRYWDESTYPLYSFGYGLSYTKFAFSNLKLEKQSIKRDGRINVTVDLQNTGTVAGDEVAQLYIHQRYGSASRPVRQLKGFQRVTLAPGDKQTLQFSLGKDELKFWTYEAKDWVVEASDFDVWVGNSSDATLHSEFKVVD